MSLRKDSLAILRYENYEKFPIVHFGYWPETIEKWRGEGHISDQEAMGVYDASPNENIISKRLGFDYNWHTNFGAHTGLLPAFERKVLEELPNGHLKVLDENGAIVLDKPGIVSIPAEIGHTLQDRESWEKDYKHRLTFSEARLNYDHLEQFKDDSERQIPIGIHLGSLFGNIRNYLGIEGVSYLQVDDEVLYDEIIETNAAMMYEGARRVLEFGAKPDYGHFWEDICFKNGPLVSPAVFDEKVGPWYKRFSELLLQHDIDLISLDCDGMIDALIPTWIENGINVMFPIEVGTWEASIAPWREKYGKVIRGVGGMNKTVFSQDYAAVDREIERLKPLVELGGYIPCPDHRIAPDAKWENVQYYCQQLRKAF